MRLKIPKISQNKAISAIIKGLRYHEALRSKLLQKRPTIVAELLAIAKNYVDADDTEKLIREDVRGTQRDHPPRRDDNRDNRGRIDNCNHRHNDNRDCREGWDRCHHHCDDFRGKRPRENNHEVNTVKRSAGHRDYHDDYNKALKGPCQLHPRSSHTMENHCILKNIYVQQIIHDNATKAAGTPIGVTARRTMTTRIGILVISTSI